jgi:pyruvate dehydrogenase E2 component (dihydrolipoamide acetyltransferase)
VKAEGDPVSNGDVLAEIETDKATMELVSRGEGILRKILLREGGTVPVGEVIGIIAAEGEDISDLVEEGVGPSTSEAASAAEVAGTPQTEGGAPTQAQVPTAAPTGTEGGVAEAKGEEGRVKASPLARRLAEEARVDLSRLQGSGPGGRIVKRDVESASVLPFEGGVPLPSSAGSAPSMPSGEEGPDFQDVPLTQMRKTIARRLVESLGPVPHFFLRITVDMSRIQEARQRLNHMLEREREKLSVNDFFLKATAQALHRHPEVNAQWAGDAVRRHFRVHLGVAVAVEEGLITPVVRDAHEKGLLQISREVRALAERGREKRLQPEEYTGSTFSVSNLGMFGIHEFTGVINPPEAGILAVGGIEDTPVVEGGQVVIRPLMKVTMSCDHRVIDGATGAAFLQTLKGMLEEPAAILL